MTGLSLEPILFEPILQPRRWGGDRLATCLGKQLPHPDGVFGESWELVDRHDYQSRILDGEHAGKSIRELIQLNGEQIFGRSGCENKQFPFLIKFLDCQHSLSVQVHPNDDHAKASHPQETGKNEAWIILEAEPDSVVYAGFQPGTTTRAIREAIAACRLQDLLKTYPARSGDCFFIPAGTVHAIGAGLVVAEVQQPSDVTYRLYDWGCVDQQGQPRPLHIEEALACITLDDDFNPLVPRQPEHDSPDQPAQSIVSPYFQIDVYQFSQGKLQVSHKDECLVMMMLAGSGAMQSGVTRRDVKLGQTWLLPACNGEFSVEATAPVTIALVREPH